MRAKSPYDRARGDKLVSEFSKSLNTEIERKNQKKIDELSISKDGSKKYTKTEDESFIRRAKERFSKLERERTDGSLDKHGSYWSNW